MNQDRGKHNIQFRPGIVSWTWVFRIWVAVAVSLFLPATVWAHGGGTPQLAGEAAGPYRLYAWTSPEPWRAGEVHIDVAVAKAGEQGAEIPVTDANVRLHVTHGETGETLEMIAEPLDFLNSFYYEADFLLPSAGVWQVELHIAGDDGEGSIDFTVEALPPRQVNWLLLGGGSVLLVVVAVLWAYWSAHNPPPTRPARRGQIA